MEPFITLTGIHTYCIEKEMIPHVPPKSEVSIIIIIKKHHHDNIRLDFRKPIQIMHYKFQDKLL